MKAFLSIILFSLLSSTCKSKVVSGDFKLSGIHTEHVLSSYAVMPTGGRIEVKFKTHKEHYKASNPLVFRLYRDTDWPKYLRALTCVEKKRYAVLTKEIEFHQHDENWEGKVETFILNDADGSSRRNHYWYFVVDDCSLEQYLQDEEIPKMHFKLTVKNEISKGTFTHLSADEQHLTVLHTFTAVLSGLVAWLLLMRLFLDLADGKKSVHAALLWVAAAACLDSLSSVFEIIHLQA
jgi:hypothetical protein